AEHRRLGYAALDLGERQAAEQSVPVRREDEVGVTGAVPHLALVAAQAPPEGELGQIVRWPDWLPGREERAALLAQPRPLRIVAEARHSQQHAIAADHLARGRRGDRSQERHRRLVFPTLPPARPGGRRGPRCAQPPWPDRRWQWSACCR